MQPVWMADAVMGRSILLKAPEHDHLDPSIKPLVAGTMMACGSLRTEQ